MDLSYLDEQVNLDNQHLNCTQFKELGGQHNKTEENANNVHEDNSKMVVPKKVNKSFSGLFGNDSSDEEFEGPCCKQKVDKEITDKIESMKTKANVLKQKGNDFIKEGKYELALEQYTQAISLYNEDPAFFANRAVCYIKLNNLQAAETDCSEAIKLDYKYVKAYLRRSAVRRELNNVEGACRDLQSIVILEPNNIIIKREFFAMRDKILSERAYNRNQD